jgi:hypothetical protein
LRAQASGALPIEQAYNIPLLLITIGARTFSGVPPPNTRSRASVRNGTSYLWEGTRPFAMRFAQLSPEQCEVVDVRTKRGVTRALLFRKALLRAEWKAEALPREALAMKRQRLRGRPKKRRGAPSSSV